MGHSHSEKVESHDRILKVAAARFREAGLGGIGVDGLMKEAGLTHGGFYRHFASREELVTEAVERALSDGGRLAVEAMGQNKNPLAALISAYLSSIHRDRLDSSCAVTTLAADVARSNDRTRSAYTKQVNLYLELLVKLIQEEKLSDKRMKAISALSTLVGALSMARAVNDKKLSKEILRSAAKELKSRLAESN